MLERSRGLSSLLQDRCSIGSILQQAGAILLSGAFLLLACWVMAVARGPAAYARFLSPVTPPLLRVTFALGLSALVLHSCSTIHQRLRDGGTGLEHRGRRSSVHGVHFSWMKRVTAPGLMLVGAWFLAAAVSIDPLNYVQVSAWMAGTWNALFLLGLILVGAENSSRAVSAIIESGVQDAGMRLAMLLLIRGVHLVAAASAALAVYAMAFGNLH